MHDRAYLRDVQYRDDANLSARAELHRRFGTHRVGFHRWVFDHLELPPDAWVLEVGCGHGLLWEANADRVPPGWTVLLTDFSLGMIGAARRRLGGRWRFAVADGEALPHPAGRFDAVIADHVLYHVPDRHRAIREMARVLRPHGSLYAATNGGDHMRELDELASRRLGAGRVRRGAARFGLEDGAGQLGQAFARVELRPRPGELLITEAEPAAAYLRSVVGDDWDAEPLRREVAAEIEREGAFRVRTSMGLFVARSPLQSRS